MKKLTKKSKQPKEPVRIRFKQLVNGAQSIYLDIYVEGKRTYEFLKLYLIPETNAMARTQNAVALSAANKLKSEKIIEITANRGGIKALPNRSKLLVQDWMNTYYEDCERRGRRGNAIIKNTAHVLAAFRKDAMMGNIDKDFCLKFISFLRNEYISQYGRKLSEMTGVSYLGCFRGALNAAVSAGVIAENPLNRLSAKEKIKMPESKREYLTIEEVKKLIATPCPKPIVKSAFLTSCYCGLRISDIKRLTWGDITIDGDQWRINLVMHKTGTPIYLPLSKQARTWMPERGGRADTDLVFGKMPVDNIINKAIAEWAKAAGISKKVTYHTSRHTMATMLLTLGADLYTVSKLLGHSRIETTQIYGKIINKKKDDAIGLLDDVFGE